MARFFKKLYTQQKENIDDDFPELDDDKIGDHLGFKVITNLKKDVYSFKSTAFKHPNGSDVEGTLEPEIKIQDYDVVVKGKIQTSNKYETTVSLNDKIVKGTTFFITGKVEVSNKETVELGFDYLNKEMGSLNLKVISPYPFDSELIELYCAGVGYYQGVSIGGDVQFKPSTREVSKANGYVQFDNNEMSAAGFVKFTNGKGTKVGFGHHHKVNDTTSGALEISVDTSNTSNTILKVVGNHKFDDHTTLRPRVSVYGLSKEVRVGFVLKQTLSSIAKLTLSSDLSTHTLFQQEGKFKKNQFGVTLSFFD